MNLEDSDTLSSVSSSLSSASGSSIRSSSAAPRPSNAPRARSTRISGTNTGYWWREEEALLFDELVAAYGTDPVDWKEVERELARQCPMDPAPARTAQQCSARAGYFRNRRAPKRAYGRTFWDLASWTQLETQVIAMKKKSGSERVTAAQWMEVGETLEPKRSGVACSHRWVMGAPSRGVYVHDPRAKTKIDEDQASNQPSSSTPASVSSARPMRSLSPPQVEGLITAADRTTLVIRPFFAEDDAELLRLHSKHPHLYKTIARAMRPQRHKKDVRARLEQLLAEAPPKSSTPASASASASMFLKRSLSSSTTSHHPSSPPSKIPRLSPRDDPAPSPPHFSSFSRDERAARRDRARTGTRTVAKARGGKESSAEGGDMDSEGLQAEVKGLKRELGQLKRVLGRMKATPKKRAVGKPASPKGGSLLGRWVKRWWG